MLCSALEMKHDVDGENYNVPHGGLGLPCHYLDRSDEMTLALDTACVVLHLPSMTVWSLSLMSMSLIPKVSEFDTSPKSSYSSGCGGLGVIILPLFDRAADHQDFEIVSADLAFRAEPECFIGQLLNRGSVDVPVVSCKSARDALSRYLNFKVDLNPSLQIIVRHPCAQFNGFPLIARTSPTESPAMIEQGFCQQALRSGNRRG